MAIRDVFYGKDIPDLFPKPSFWPAMSEIEPDKMYSIKEFNHANKHIDFEEVRLLRTDGKNEWHTDMPNYSVADCPTCHKEVPHKPYCWECGQKLILPKEGE